MSEAAVMVNPGAGAEVSTSPQAQVDAPPSFADILDIEKTVLAPGAAEGELPPEAPPAVPSVEAPPPTEPAKPTPETKPVEKPVEPVKPVEPLKPPAEPEGPPKVMTLEQVAEHRKRAVDSIAARFAIGDEDQQLLVSEPHKVLPKLAAEIQVGTYEMVLAALSPLLPGLVAQAMQHHETAKGGENSFFERWPDLKDQKFNKTIREVSTGYRRAFPQASVEEAIEDIGAMVMRKHSLAASPVPREKLTSPLPKPFVPAGAGAASGPAPTKPLASDEARMWAELVKD